MASHNDALIFRVASVTQDVPRFRIRLTPRLTRIIVAVKRPSFVMPSESRGASLLFFERLTGLPLTYGTAFRVATIIHERRAEAFLSRLEDLAVTADRRNEIGS
jgi:hypothetical protein